MFGSHSCMSCVLASNLVLMRYSRGGATSGCAVGVRVRVRDD